MTEKIYAIMAFVGLWLLYIFPLFQMVLELSEPNRLFKEFREDYQKYPEVSPWYWLIPPLKINKEKQRGIQMVREHISEPAEIDQLFRYFNKAVAWFYISVAGALNGLIVSRDLFATFGIGEHWGWLVVVDLLMIALGIVHVAYRFDSNRKDRKMGRLFNKRK